MGLVDSMGALTDYHKRFRGFSPWSTPAKSLSERRTGTRLVCQRFESQDEDICSPRKRTRTLIGSPEKRQHQHQHRLQFSADIFPPPLDALANSANLIFRSSKPPDDYHPRLIFRSNFVSKLDLIPPPRPLSRTLQGPQRPRMGSSSESCCGRVSKGAGLSELEDEFNAAARYRYEKRFEMARAELADSVDFDALEQYRKRVADLQQRFADSTPGRNNDNDNGGVEDGVNKNNKWRSCAKGSQREHPGSAGHSSLSAMVACGGLDCPPGNIYPGKEVGIAAKDGGKIENQGNESPLYLDLLQKASERDITLKAIDLEVQLTATRLEALQLINRERFQKNEQETEDRKLLSGNELLQKEEREPAKRKSAAVQRAFAPLTDDEEADISRALHGRNRREVLVMHENSNIEITREILQCLLPSTWLNDEVINLYLELLKEREKREPKKFLKCHFFNTFFYKKLFNPKSNYDYKAVRRWTTQKKIGYSLMDCEKIFVPIHKEIHWCLAIIDMRKKKFQYLDSLKGTDARVLKILARYITDEAKDKTGKDLDVSTWEQEYVDFLPEQENGWDCGMFMIKYADFHSQDLPLNFCQANMPYFRKRTAKEILRLRAE